MEPKVSIIVPIFNAQSYLERCINSLCAQTLHEIEIICVDDGSTDLTPEILRHYAAQDARVRIISQENKRQGGARNSGMDIARGSYLYFVDADDYIDPSSCEMLYKAAVQYNADVACGSIRKERKQGNRWAIHFEEIQLHEGMEARFKAVNCPPDFYVLHKLINRKKLCQLGIRFAEGVQYEDVMFLAHLLHGVERLITVPGPAYHYIAHKGSTVKGKQTKIKQQQHYEALRDFVRFAEEIDLPLSAKHRTVTKRTFQWLGVTVFKIKERNGREYGRLFDLIPIFTRKIGGKQKE